MPWKGKRALYMPLNVDKRHWVVVKVDLELCKLIVFDCNIFAYGNKAMKKSMEPLYTILSIILKQSKAFVHLEANLEVSWTYEIIPNLPQNTQ